MASPVVFPLLWCPCLTKKLTVIGTIGQTQGITRASRPPPAEKSRNESKPCWARWATSLVTSALASGDASLDDAVATAGAMATSGVFVSDAGADSDEGGVASAFAGAA